jgi:integrase
MAKWKKPVGRPFLALRGHTYYARLTVPTDARDYFGKTELWQSLKTNNLREAEYRAGRIVAEWKAQIETFRGNVGIAHRALEWRRILDDERKKDQALIEQFKRQHGRNVSYADEANELGLGIQNLVYSDEFERLYLEEGPDIAKRFDAIVQGNSLPTMTYAEDYKASLKVIPRTLQQRETHLDYLNQRFSTLPVKRSDVAKWIIEMETQNLAEATIKACIGTCRGYFEYLQRLDHLNPDEANPFEGHKYTRRKKASKQDIRQAFEVADILRLIDAAERKGRKDSNLVAAIKIAAYTGMRREEIARLRVENVRESEAIRYFDIIDAKSKAGLREVPIHSELLALVDKLIKASSDGYLLPDEKITKNDERSDAIGKRFKTLRDGLGFDSRYVFHSIRKTVSTIFERAGVNHNEAAEIVGHEKTSMTYGLYSAGMDIGQKSKLIQLLKYKN